MKALSSISVQCASLSSRRCRSVVSNGVTDMLVTSLQSCKSISSIDGQFSAKD